MTKRYLVSLLISLGLSSLGYAADDPFKIATPENLAAANVSAANSARASALREFALSKGLAEGRKARFKDIYQYFEQNKRVLDTIYQVDHLYMQPRKKQTIRLLNGLEQTKYKDDPAFKGFLIQPPIILEGNDIMQIASDGQRKEKSTIRYGIAANAQFVSAPLYWQTFLVAPEDLIAQGPADDPLLQPRDEQERAMMLAFYQVGFNEGVSQATSEVQTRTKTLATMVAGMHYGRILMEKNILDEPEVTTQYVPVSGNKTLLTLDTSVAQITLPSGFVLDPTKYKVIIHQANPLEKR